MTPARFLMVTIIGERSEPLSRVFNDQPRGIGECGSTLYVGLSGSSEPNTKVYGIRPHLFKHFFLGMSRAGVNTKDATKKQIRRIHSVFSHVRP